VNSLDLHSLPIHWARYDAFIMDSSEKGNEKSGDKVTTNTSHPENGRNVQPPYTFWLVITALLLLAVTFLLVVFLMFQSGIIVDTGQVVVALASFFAVVGTLVGTYFGIKSSRDATTEIDRVAGASGDYAERLAQAKPDDILTIAGTQTDILTGYYTAVLAQANQSFRWALVVALVGLAFFLGAVAFLLTRQDQSAATVSVIGGALVEVISGVMFYLYGKTTAQLADYQQRLAQTQRFLLANAICESLEGEEKQKARSSLVHTIADMNSTK
jgi:hypothetical protein